MFKRMVDVFGAGVSLLILSPLLALVAAAIRLEDGGPVLFRQPRAGRNGSTFALLKFRSMPEHTPHVASAEAAALAITRVGRFIRRTNIDELPQLINILMGTMSIVGPRPALLSQSELIELRGASGADRLRPGLTGMAQVHAYDGMSVTEKAHWDARYSRNVSFLTDSGIVLRTFAYLLRPPPRY